MEDVRKIKFNLVPFDTAAGFDIRPGFYEINGATAIPGGVNFTIHSHGATSCELLLFHRMEKNPFAIIKIPENYRIGNVYSIIIFKLDIEQFEYAYRMDGPYRPEKGILFDKTKELLDPYARAVTGQSIWGKKMEGGNKYKARVVRDDFDWGDSTQPLTPLSDVIIYEMHVRGFTRDVSAGVHNPGTFAGLMEKIPYLIELGVTAVELMPIFEFDELLAHRNCDGEELIDYWGYNSVCFFAPNTSYCSAVEFNREGTELKCMIQKFHENGIEVYLDVVFNHTAEGNENGPFFSFKGIDNNIYYMLTPDGYYYNFSGCGNTLNCNHPIVQQMILECLRYWVTTYRVDGFRFDLASILGRNEDGSPMSKPPLLQSLAFDPILGDVKLIAEAWDAGGLYQVGSFPAWNRWIEWNGQYRDNMRAFLKGDEGMIEAAVSRVTGSQDMYDVEQRGHNASINFLNCHDGFTLYDMYAYNQKHNEKNGWNNTDGCDSNYSWNCGAEGETEDEEVNRLRMRLMKNAAATLLMSRGVPMFLSGDEFGDTRYGNNNPYCQDNMISWLDWTLLDKNQELFEFFKYMIAFRKKHTVIRRDTQRCSLNFPIVSVQGHEAWQQDFGYNQHVFGVMYAGRNEKNTRDDIVMYLINSYWESQTVSLPELREGYNWGVMADTWEEQSILNGKKSVTDRIELHERSVVILAVCDR